MAETSAYEQEREANIARNRALLEQLELKDAVANLGVPVKHKAPPKLKAKPAPAAKRVKREREEAPRRQSARLRKGDEIDPNETPAQKRRRLEKAEERQKKEEEERMLAEEQRRLAQRPREQDLDLEVLTTQQDENIPDEEMSALKGVLQVVADKPIGRAIGSVDAWVFESDKHEEREVRELRKKLGNMKIVARAKVIDDRVYCAMYHPEPTKDLVFFGDKHGQLGIWDARAPAEAVADEDEDVTEKKEQEGRYWQLQLHWPATAKSSISSIKIDPIDSHSLYTTAYDCTVRQFSFVSGISRQIYSSDDILLTSLELIPSGHEVWISDAAGGVTHLDLREGPSRARWYGLSDQKIGSVSVNPTSPHLILTASNSRHIRIWDARKLNVLATSKHKRMSSSSPPSSPTKSSSGLFEFDSDQIQKFVASKTGNGVLRGEHAHGKSATSAYWDPRGRSIVSTSYDDTLRIWELDAGKYDNSPVFPALAPFSRIRHDCQTGRWLTPLRAVWSPNPDVYPYFTVANLDHSLQMFSCKGELVAKLSHPTITATQTVTCSHPSVVERCATGNASGRCILWAPPDLA